MLQIGKFASDTDTQRIWNIRELIQAPSAAFSDAISGTTSFTASGITDFTASDTVSLLASVVAASGTAPLFASVVVASGVASAVPFVEAFDTSSLAPFVAASVTPFVPFKYGSNSFEWTPSVPLTFAP
jgi:hypothetical protein